MICIVETRFVIHFTQAQQYQRMTQTVEQAQTPVPLDDVYRRLMNANTREDLDAIIRESGI